MAEQVPSAVRRAIVLHRYCQRRSSRVSQCGPPLRRRIEVGGRIDDGPESLKWDRRALIVASGSYIFTLDQFSPSEWSGLPRQCCQGLYRSGSRGDDDEPTVELDEGGSVEGPGPDPVAVRRLDRGLELEPSEGCAERVRAP